MVMIFMVFFIFLNIGIFKIHYPMLLRDRTTELVEAKVELSLLFFPYCFGRNSDLNAYHEKDANFGKIVHRFAEHLLFLDYSSVPAEVD